MKRLTALSLEYKNQDDAEMIGLYKKQIAQLAACIADRESRIARRTPIIQKISEREKSEFNRKLSRASDDARTGPLKVGDHFRDGQEYLTIMVRADQSYSIYNETHKMFETTAKDLDVLSQVFYFDHPLAVRI